MRFAYMPKLSAIIFAAVLLAAPMADATKPGDKKVEEATEAFTDVVTEGVNDKHHVHEPRTKARKPRIGNMGLRQSWEDCVGMEVSEAIEVIKAARPDLKKVIKVREGMMVTADIRMDRVRVFCNEQDVVTRPPRIG